MSEENQIELALRLEQVKLIGESIEALGKNKGLVGKDLRNASLTHLQLVMNIDDVSAYKRGLGQIYGIVATNREKN